MIGIKTKDLVMAVFMLLPALSWAQSKANQMNESKNNQNMENVILIGKIFIPKNSVEEFRSQNVTNSFIRTRPGFLKGELYEMFDESGNLHMITITTWATEENYHNAQTALKEHYKVIKFDPLAFRERLKIVAEHNVYSLHAY